MIFTAQWCIFCCWVNNGNIADTRSPNSALPAY